LEEKETKVIRFIEPGVGVVLLGFILLLVLMAGLILSGRQQMLVINERLLAIVDEQNVKTDLVYTMRFSARERSLDMQSALLIDDWVERDALMLHYNSMGAQFARARLALLEMKLTDKEEALLNQQSEVTGDVVEMQNHIFDLAVEGDIEKATLLLNSEAIPGQNRVFAILNQLIDVQRASAENLAKKAQVEYEQVRSNMIVLGLAVLLLSIAIATYVIITISRYGRQRRKDNESLNQMAAFPEQNPSPVFEFDFSGNIIYLNPAAKAQFPFLKGPADEKILFESLGQPVERLRSAQQGMLKKESKIGERFFQSWVTLVDEKEAVRIYLLDITDQKRSEAELKEHRDHLEEMVAQRTSDLSIAVEELEAFCYSVSHDLRAPLRVIDGFSQALLEDYNTVVDEDGQDLLVRVRRGAQNMSQLIDDLLRLSRVTRGDFNESTIDLTSMAREIEESLREESPERPVSLTIAEGMKGWGDPQLLKIVMVNLLSNAWKYTKMKQRAVIDVGLTREDGETVYYIRDNGVGFKQEYAKKVFEPFHRLHGSEYEGSGIGLATVFRVLRRHNGRIWVVSQVGMGTCFYFTLPPAIQAFVD
jgi:signal transduction histidine kinase